MRTSIHRHNEATTAAGFTPVGEPLVRLGQQIVTAAGHRIVDIADEKEASTAVGFASASKPLVCFGLGANRSAEEIEIRRLESGRKQIVDIAEEVRP